MKALTKFTAALAALTMAVAFTACDDGDDDDDGSTTVTHYGSSSAAAPTDFKVTKTDDRKNTYTFSWTGNGSTGYQILYADSDDFTKAAGLNGNMAGHVTVADSKVNSTIDYTFTLTKKESGLGYFESGTTYYFWVRAEDDASIGTESKSTSVSFTYETVTAPTNVMAEKSDGAIRVLWTGTEYQYTVRFTKGSSNKTKTVQGTSYTFPTDTSDAYYLDPSATHTIEVCANDGANNSTFVSTNYNPSN